MTPATIATSARLNTYQLKRQSRCVMWNSTKSATAPIGQPVDRVADRPADDQPERNRR